MRIGIDISQMAFEGTGVARYVREMVKALLAIDKENEYILLGASLRKRKVFYQYFNTVRYLSKNVSLVVIPVPPTLLDWLWNKLHILPVEWLIGPIDVFWSSDWTQPPLAKAKSITTIHDVSFLKYPESFAKEIVEVQKRRLKWVKEDCQTILCDSEATKRDVKELLGIELSRIQVVYPGLNYDYRN